MGLTNVPIDVVGITVFVGAVVALSLLAVAPAAAEALIRWRAGRLPQHLAERFGEEWIAEVREIDTRARKLTFAVAIALTRTRTLTDAEADGAALALGARSVVLSVEDVRVHTDFGNRFPAYLIDFAIAFALALMLRPFRPDDFYATGLFALASTTAMFLVLQVFCVVRFGGSPGKLLMKLRIVPQEGDTLTIRHALLRIAPEYALSVAGYAVGFYALAQLDVDALGALGPREQAALVNAAVPWWLPSLLSFARCIWALADMAVFFLSLERRALHDLIAGTVVILKVPRVVGALDVPDEPRSMLIR
jgi:uncharacterized RDD family membrane protein YckC